VQVVIVLGIDPGLARTGYGVVEKTSNTLTELDYGYISSPVRMALSERIYIVYKSVLQLLAQHSPEALAVEQLFFCKNVRTAMQVGEARGAVLTAAAQQGVQVFEYTPLQVKQAVAGYGRAEKKQVQQMVCLLLNLAEPPKPDDAADALAVAICHIQSSMFQKRVAEKIRKDQQPVQSREERGGKSR